MFQGVVAHFQLGICQHIWNWLRCFWRNGMNRYLFFACVIVLGGCVSPGTDSTIASSSTENFQLHTGPDGRVYRISSQSGKTSWLDGSTYRDVTEQTMPQLVVGKVYSGESADITYRYEGGGKLEKWGLDRYMIKPSQDVSPQK